MLIFSKASSRVIFFSGFCAETFVEFALAFSARSCLAFSAKEIKAKLLKTVDETSAQKAVDRYIEAGYINDEKYCQRLIEYLLNVKKFSLTNIKQECYKRGISRDIVDEKLSNFEIDNVATLVDLIKNKYATKLQKENGKEKVIASLQRKGFHYSDIKSAFYRIEYYDE